MVATFSSFYAWLINGIGFREEYRGVLFAELPPTHIYLYTYGVGKQKFNRKNGIVTEVKNVKWAAFYCSLDWLSRLHKQFPRYSHKSAKTNNCSLKIYGLL